MSSYTLFIFEGTTERNVVDSLKGCFFDNSGNSIVYASYGHNIYQLCSELSEDEGLDTYSVLCEAIARREDSNDDILDIPQHKISDIYLFFDYDPHTTNAGDQKLVSMLEKFNNSQESGKLFVSYPMLEAIRHVPELNYGLISFPIDQLKDYKKYLKARDENQILKNVMEYFFNWGLYSKDTWIELIKINLVRANILVNQRIELPENYIEQLNVFESQKLHYIKPLKHVAVISAFPLMLLEYYGANLLTTLQTSKRLELGS